MFFDLQVNGFAGVDFQQPDLSCAALESALRALQARQTRILFTLITDRVEAMCAKLERVESMRRDLDCGDVIAGYHLEGPCLNPTPGFHGAHPPELMKAPDIADLERLWTASGGRIRLITLAPEWRGSIEYIRCTVARGVCMAIGHSDADNATIDNAIEAGLTMCTHLGNGVPVHLHRHDNIIQRLLSRDELHAAFIPDGIHLPPGVLRNLVRAKPAERVIFTTDCMAAAGAGA
ncbi:MAG: N-acetylglucosamine-6-phosphate deacetylase, partial [Opitutaceae bacterium]